MEIKKSDLYDYLFCVLIIFLPYSLAVPNIITILLALFFIIDFKDPARIDFKVFKRAPLVILAILITYWLLKGIITGSITETKYSLLGPIVLLPVLFLKVTNVNRILLGLVFSGLFVSVRAAYGLVNHYSASQSLELFEGQRINEILGMERPYLGFFLVIASIASFQLSTVHRHYRYWFYVYCVVIFLFICLISARISALTLVLLTVLLMMFYNNMRIKKRLSLLVISCFILLLPILSNENLRDRLFITFSKEESMTAFKRYEPRVIIWDCGYQIATANEFNVISGLDSEEELNRYFAECYGKTMANKHRANFFKTSKLNSHNQFLGTYLTSGLLGLTLLLAFFVSMLMDFKKEFFQTAFITALFLFFVVENVLRRQFGTYLFAIILCIVFLWPVKHPGQSVDTKTVVI